MESQQQAFQQSQKEITELSALSKQLPDEVQKLQAELESEKENYENARSAVEEAEVARARKKKHLQEGHELYESRLALKIQTSKKDGNIVMRMHNIDPRNPARQFYFSIVVISDKYAGAFALACSLSCSVRAETGGCSGRLDVVPSIIFLR